MKRNIKTVIAGIFTTIFLSQAASAVPVGTTPDTRPAAPQQRKQWNTHGLTVDLGGNYLQGNVNIINFNSSLSYNYNFERSQFFIDTGTILSRAGDTTLVNRINGSFLYAYNIFDNLNFYYYQTHSHDSSTKLDYRLTNGAGLCLHRIAEPFFKLFLISINPATENEWFSDTPHQLTLRGVFRVSMAIPVSDLIDVGLDSFYSPAVNDFSDYRLYGEYFLRIKLIEDSVNLKVSVADEYDSKPLAAVKNNDFGIFMNLTFNLGD